MAIPEGVLTLDEADPVNASSGLQKRRSAALELGGLSDFESTGDRRQDVINIAGSGLQPAVPTGATSGGFFSDAPPRSSMAELEPEPDSDAGLIANTYRQAKKTAVDLVGGLMRARGTFTDALPFESPLDGTRIASGGKFSSGELSRDIGEIIDKEVDFGGVPREHIETVIDNAKNKEWVALVNSTARFIVEKFGASIPHMVALANPTTTALWIASMGEQLSEDRAEADNREVATGADKAVTYPSAALIGMVDRLGLQFLMNSGTAGRIMNQWLGNAGRGKTAGIKGLAEGTQEAAEESFEYTATNLGTETGVSREEYGKRALGGFLVGEGSGTTIGALTYNAKRQAEEMQALANGERPQRPGPLPPPGTPSRDPADWNASPEPEPEPETPPEAAGATTEVRQPDDSGVPEITTGGITETPDDIRAQVAELSDPENPRKAIYISPNTYNNDPEEIDDIANETDDEVTAAGTPDAGFVLTSDTELAKGYQSLANNPDTTPAQLFDFVKSAFGITPQEEVELSAVRTPTSNITLDQALSKLADIQNKKKPDSSIVIPAALLEDVDAADKLSDVIFSPDANFKTVFDADQNMIVDNRVPDFAYYQKGKKFKDAGVVVEPGSPEALALDRMKRVKGIAGTTNKAGVPENAEKLEVRKKDKTVYTEYVSPGSLNARVAEIQTMLDGMDFEVKYNKPKKTETPQTPQAETPQAETPQAETPQEDDAAAGAAAAAAAEAQRKREAEEAEAEAEAQRKREAEEAEEAAAAEMREQRAQMPWSERANLDDKKVQEAITDLSEALYQKALDTEKGTGANADPGVIKAVEALRKELNEHAALLRDQEFGQVAERLRDIVFNNDLAFPTKAYAELARDTIIDAEDLTFELDTLASALRSGISGVKFAAYREKTYQEYLRQTRLDELRQQRKTGSSSLEEMALSIHELVDFEFLDPGRSNYKAYELNETTGTVDLPTRVLVGDRKPGYKAVRDELTGKVASTDKYTDSQIAYINAAIPKTLAEGNTHAYFDIQRAQLAIAANRILDVVGSDSRFDVDLLERDATVRKSVAEGLVNDPEATKKTKLQNAKAVNYYGDVLNTIAELKQQKLEDFESGGTTDTGDSGGNDAGGGDTGASGSGSTSAGGSGDTSSSKPQTGGKKGPVPVNEAPAALKKFVRMLESNETIKASIEAGVKKGETVEQVLKSMATDVAATFKQLVDSGRAGKPGFLLFGKAESSKKRFAGYTYSDDHLSGIISEAAKRLQGSVDKRAEVAELQAKEVGAGEVKPFAGMQLMQELGGRVSRIEDKAERSAAEERLSAFYDGILGLQQETLVTVLTAPEVMIKLQRLTEAVVGKDDTLTDELKADAIKLAKVIQDPDKTSDAVAYILERRIDKSSLKTNAPQQETGELSDTAKDAVYQGEVAYATNKQQAESSKDLQDELKAELGQAKFKALLGEFNASMNKYSKTLEKGLDAPRKSKYRKLWYRHALNNIKNQESIDTQFHDVVRTNRSVEQVATADQGIALAKAQLLKQDPDAGAMISDMELTYKDDPEALLKSLKIAISFNENVGNASFGDDLDTPFDNTADPVSDRQSSMPIIDHVQVDEYNYGEGNLEDFGDSPQESDDLIFSKRKRSGYNEIAVGYKVPHADLIEVVDKFIGDMPRGRSKPVSSRKFMRMMMAALDKRDPLYKRLNRLVETGVDVRLDFTVPNGEWHGLFIPATFDVTNTDGTVEKDFRVPVRIRAVKQDMTPQGIYFMTENIAHEMGHAVTVQAVVDKKNTALRARLNSFIRELRDMVPNGHEVHELSDEFEFLAGLYGHNAFRQQLAELELPPIYSETAGKFDKRGLGHTDYFASQKTRAQTAFQYVRELIRAMVRRVFGDKFATDSALNEALRLAEPFTQTDSQMLANREQRGIHQDDILAAYIEGRGVLQSRRDPWVEIQENSPEVTPNILAELKKRLSGGDMVAVESMADNIKNVLSSKGILSFHQMDQLERRFDRDSGGRVSKYVDILRNKQTIVNQERKRADAVVRRWKRAERQHASSTGALNQLLIDSTIAQLDPSLGFLSATNRHWYFDESKRKEHAELRKRFKALPEPLQAVLVDVGKFFSDHQKRARHVGAVEVLNTNERLARLNDKTQNEIAKRLMAADTVDAMESILRARLPGAKRTEFAQLFEAIQSLRNTTQIRGIYAPLRRFGDIVVNASRTHVTPAFGSVQEMHEFRQAVEANQNPDFRKNSQVEQDKLNPLRLRITEQSTQMVGSEAEADRVFRELEAEFGSGNVEVSTRSQYDSAAVAGASSQFINLLKKNAKSAHYAKIIDHTRIQMLAEQSVRKSELTRDGIDGASLDMSRAFAERAMGGAWTIADLSMSRKEAEALNELEAYVRERGKRYGQMSGRERAKNYALGRLVDELKTREGESLEQRTTPGWIDKLTTLGYYWYLASPAYTIVNLTQTALITLPYLSAKFGGIDATAALGRNMGQVLKAVDSDGMYAFVKEMRRTHMGFGDMTTEWTDMVANSIGGLKGQMFKLFIENGLIDATFIQELDNALSGSYDPDAISEGFSRWALTWAKSWPQMVEQFNRMATAGAAYDLAMDKWNDHDKAMKFAAETVRETQLDYSDMNRNRAFKSMHGLGRIVFMFQTYTQGVMALYTKNIARMASTQVNRPDLSDAQRQELRMTALKEIAGITAAHVIAAGAVGLPQPLHWLFGLLNWAWGMVDDDARADQRSVVDMLEDAVAKRFSPDVAEAITRGVPQALGVSLHNNVGLQSMFIQPGQGAATSSENATHEVASLAGPLGSTYISIRRGFDYFSSGQYVKMAEASVPRGVRDFIKAARYANDGGPTDFKGTQLAELNMAEVLLRGIGLGSGTETRMYQMRTATKDLEKNTSNYSRLLKTQYLDARESGDKARLDRIRRKIAAHNKLVPWNRRINMQSIYRTRKYRREEEFRIRKGNYGTYNHKDFWAVEER